MKNLVILLAIVMVAGFVGCERKIPEEPRTYDSETEPPPSALIVRNDPRVAEDQKLVSDEVKNAARPAAVEEPGTEPGDETEPATQPGAETEPATQPGDETEPATQPAGGGEAATKPADDASGEPAL